MATDSHTSRCLHLVADVGGTNARFAFAESSDPVPAAIATYAVTDFPSFQDVLVQLQRDWVELADPSARLTKVCLAVAAIPEQEEISFTNNPWRFTRSGVAEQIGCSDVRIVNDFAAVARSLTALGPEHLEVIGGGTVVAGAPKVAIGPGTGTGVATLAFDSRGDAIVLPGEGGHVDFAPITHVEEEILSRLRAQYGRVSIERLLCGAGIMNIYRCLADIRGVEAIQLDPEDVGNSARAGGDALSGEAMNTFFSVLGAAAGNFALTLGARGGVYIAGGIAPRYIDLLRKSDFRARFHAKGRFADFNGQIATSVVTHPDPGLLGAALLCAEEGGSEY
ncbi:MAG: glucokinase [Luminiphilus sp.]|nr:glucokinase [Luminiphilus sp.]